MTQVDFYILPENAAQERFVCLMANKIWQKGHTIFLNTTSREIAESYNKLLWTYKDISFVPHEMADHDNIYDNSCPIIIGWDNNPPEQTEVLINLASNIPSHADKFARIIEIVSGDHDQKQQSRDKYRIYRDNEYDLKNHTIESNYDNI